MEYKEFSSSFTFDFWKLVDLSRNIVITAHESPDEDSISSSLSIFEIISSKFPDKSLRIVFSGAIEQKYKVFRNYDKIEFVEDLADYVGETDLLIMLDGGNFSRFSNKSELLRSIPKTICIDHHSSPVDKFSLSLVIPGFSSCAEVIYRALFMDFEVDKSLAETFLLGILGDSGNFTYLKPHQTKTLEVAQRLLDISQIEIQEFLSRYKTISIRVFGIVQELIKNTGYSSSINWPNFQYSFIERSYIEENNFDDNEISEASHLYSTEYIKTIEGYTWGMVFYPKNNGDVSISCRSLPGSVNVRELVERMNLGGGHNRASGGTFRREDRPLEVAPCIEQALNWIKANTPAID